MTVTERYNEILLKPFIVGSSREINGILCLNMLEELSKVIY